MAYQVADGKNNAAGLADIDPQPASPYGVQYPELRVSADGSATFHGSAYIDLTWSSLTREQYNAILTQFGLGQGTAHNAVTVSVLDNDDTYTTYNGDAYRMQNERRAIAFWRNLVIRVTNLETPT